MNVDRAAAAQRFDELQTRAMTARDKVMQTAKEVADQSASSASMACYLAFGALVLGATVAALAGSMAVQRRGLVSEGTTDLGRPARA